jgi:hypothetical protein
MTLGLGLCGFVIGESGPCFSLFFLVYLLLLARVVLCCVALESLESADYTYTDRLPCVHTDQSTESWNPITTFLGIVDIAGKSSHSAPWTD